MSDGSAIAAEVRKRRTFAIISHPDAGKTTLTEKLLLYGGAIHVAGQVSARRRQRQATSDWMALERERGISITSTVLQFPYREYVLNLLDTPGHQDFGEDTYRTLLAADSAVMLIDAAKGVEPQTKKLFAICRERRIPLFTFMNKLDRPSRDPLELLDELESVLGIHAFPMNWPLGNGDEFIGVYDRQTGRVHRFERAAHGATRAAVQLTGASDPQLAALLSDYAYGQFRESIDLLDGAGARFDRAAMLHGDVTPVFFGSAVTNFGVELFLDTFVEMAPTPGKRSGVDPESDELTGFVFKIQANMDPRHRDRVAFVRICSGELARDMTVRNARTGAPVRLSRAMRLFADDRESLDVAYAGDVVGLLNPGAFAIGDSLYETRPAKFPPIPPFAPEHFAALRSTDVSGYKSFGKGIAQLREEGAVQVFYPFGVPRTEPILGAVGELQFEVATYRLATEYNVTTRLTPLAYRLARRVAAERERVPNVQLPSNAKLVEDWEGSPVALFESDWSLRLAEEWNPEVAFVAFTADLDREALAS
ncbi:MAG: peptide chain release factor 3 [Candidatus Eremiobacteraeota bacterium]|nr:peptide chain release factor 3 [Candidatus Eremiobacteraeota bacterium]